MTEEKTCYNCGNKNCNVYYSTVKKDFKHHFETYEYNDFDCVNHDKWEELKVEEIRMDNTETLKNALERIKELEKENTELKERHAGILEAFTSASSGDDFEMAESAREIMEMLNIPCYRHGKVVSKLTKAKALLAKWVELYKPKSKTALPTPIQIDTEQFLKEV